MPHAQFFPLTLVMLLAKVITYGGCSEMLYSQKIKFGIHKEKLKSKILSVGYPTLSDAKLDNVAKFKSSNYFNFITFI